MIYFSKTCKTNHKKSHRFSQLYFVNILDVLCAAFPILLRCTTHQRFTSNYSLPLRHATTRYRFTAQLFAAASPRSRRAGFPARLLSAASGLKYSFQNSKIEKLCLSYPACQSRAKSIAFWR